MIVTLTIGAALLLLNIWLMIRCTQARASEKVSVEDEGNEFVIRRMRAHANFIESAPLVLILLGALEYVSTPETWLWIVGIVYVIGRIAHTFGMDGGSLAKGRFVGTILTLATQLALAITAVISVYSKIL
ncbi:MAG: MAPEG family protein [Sphingorhabdus sp.]